MKTDKILVSYSAIALSAFIFSGCSSVAPDYNAVNQQWTTGNIALASATLQQNATEDNLRSEENMLWILDAGLVSGINGEYEKSAGYLDLGTACRQDDFDYNLRPQEIIKIPVFQIYNALGQGDTAAVFTRCKEIETTIDEVRDANAKQIDDRVEKARERHPIAVGSKKDGYSPLEEAKSDKAVERLIKAVYGEDFELNFERRKLVDKGGKKGQAIDEELAKLEAQKKAESVYVNPFAYWFAGAVMLNAAEDKGDLELAEQCMLFAKLANKNAPLFESEWKLANSAVNCADLATAKETVLKDSENVTYVIYEGGRAPKIGLAPIKTSLPTAVRVLVKAVVPNMPTEGTFYLPTVESCGEAPALALSGADWSRVFDYDKSLLGVFRDHASSEVASAKFRLSVNAVARAAAVVATTIAVNQAKDKNALVKAAATAAHTAALAVAVSPLELSKPDTRTWSFLARTVDVAKVKTPENGVIELNGEKINVPAKGVNFVRVRKVDKYWPATVQVFPLGKKAAPAVRLRAEMRPVAQNSAK